MKAYVVDVNVAVVANGQCSHADLKCQHACVEILEKIVRTGKIVLDNRMLVLDEYRKNLNLKGQPGVGDYFMKWAWENQAVPRRCEQVAITPQNDGFLEFPNVPELRRFDKSDKKYVAVAKASNNNPIILNAVDTDWSNYKLPLQRNGIRIWFLCPQQMNCNCG